MSNAVEFKLLAPYNQAAVLIGSFSDWKEISMQKNERGYFSTSVELEDGVYQYKFRVRSKNQDRLDRWVEINDPYVTAIDAATNNGVIRIKDGRRFDRRAETVNRSMPCQRHSGHPRPDLQPFLGRKSPSAN